MSSIFQSSINLWPTIPKPSWTTSSPPREIDKSPMTSKRRYETRIIWRRRATHQGKRKEKRNCCAIPRHQWCLVCPFYDVCRIRVIRHNLLQHRIRNSIMEPSIWIDNEELLFCHVALAYTLQLCSFTVHCRMDAGLYMFKAIPNGGSER